MIHKFYFHFSTSSDFEFLLQKSINRKTKKVQPKQSGDKFLDFHCTDSERLCGKAEAELRDVCTCVSRFFWPVCCHWLPHCLNLSMQKTKSCRHHNFVCIFSLSDGNPVLAIAMQHIINLISV